MPEQAKVSILIIDDDRSSQVALQLILDSEGWQVKVQPLASEILNEMARQEWTLILVNVALTGMSGPTFAMLRDLCQSPAVEGGKRRVRVLFMVPELLADHAQPILEYEHVPYTLKPFHLHDFLEKVSDLLLESGAIPKSIRQVRTAYAGSDRRGKDRRKARDRRETLMFAAREDYQMTDEEITEYEKQEASEGKKRYKPPTDLGQPKGR
jgi:DNA-binding response OmpR family regulator